MVRKIPNFFLVIGLFAFISILNVAQAAEKQLPTCATVLTDTVSGDQPGVEKTTFTKETEMIYLICKSEDVEKDQNIKAVWIAEDTNDVAPANYRIDEKMLEVTENASKDKAWEAKFSLSKPTAGWPLGTYHVDLYAGDKLFKTIKFSIK